MDQAFASRLNSNSSELIEEKSKKKSSLGLISIFNFLFFFLEFVTEIRRVIADEDNKGRAV